MRIKSYYSRTVEEAMAAASQELGPDAMLVRTRSAPPETRHLGEYEVVFAVDAPAGGTDGSQAEAAAAVVPIASRPTGDRLSSEVAELKKELEGMRRVLTRSAYAPRDWPGSSPEAANVYAALAAAEVSADLARDIVQTAAARVAGTRAPAGRHGPGDSAGLESAVAGEMQSRFTAEPVLGRGEATPRVVALVGPPGSGKTTTLVKLAVNFGLAARRPVMLVSVDTYRVAAADQLRSYAAILGVACQVLETVGALAQTLEENRGKELILIDTPGLGAGEADAFPELARFLATRGEVDTHLVLPASMKTADLSRAADSFAAFHPHRLLFTRMDETTSFGPVLSEAARLGRALSFFGTGQRVPEDLEPAGRARLVELILGAGGARDRHLASA